MLADVLVANLRHYARLLLSVVQGCSVCNAQFFQYVGLVVDIRAAFVNCGGGTLADLGENSVAPYGSIRRFHLIYFSMEYLTSLLPEDDFFGV